MSLAEIAIKRPLLITVVFASLILFGLISYNKLNYNLLPKFDANVVTVITTYRGASAEEIENTVTKKIEEALSSLEGVDQISSSSMENASIITIELLNGVDVNQALADAQRKVDQISSDLPTEIDKPIINKFSSDEIPVLRMGLTADIGARELYDILDLQIKPQISNVTGVGQVDLIGASERQIRVRLDQDKLEAYKLSVGQVAQLVNYSGLSTPAGNIKTNEFQYSIKYDSKYSNVDDLRNLPLIQYPDGGKVYLRDVADVTEGEVEMEMMTHVNGVPSIGIQVKKQSDANAVEVSKLVKERLAKIEEQYASINLKFNIASDQSTYTLESANAVVFDLVLAIGIVSIVMLMFLHSVRSSLFVLVALPASMIPTFIFMYMFGMSLNLMTLMALSLVVGILVDDSIVILENIYRHMEMGKDRRKASLEGRAEIGFTAIAITLVDVVVFVPLALSGGIIGNILREFALVVVGSTLMSLLVCFTLTPLLASRFGRLEHLSKSNLWGRINIWFEDLLTSMRDGYTRILNWALTHKRYVLGGTLVLLIGSFMLPANGFIGQSFIKKADRGELAIKLEMSAQTSVYQTNQIVQQAEKIILAHPETQKVMSNIGYSSSGVVAASNSNLAEMTITMIDKKERKISDEEFGITLQKEISQIPGVKVTVGQVSITGQSEPDLQIAIKSPDREQMRDFAGKIRVILENTKGTKYVEYSTKDPKPEVVVTLDRERMAQYGINSSEVAMAIATNFRGNDQTKFKKGGNEYDIMIEADAADKRTIDNVRNLTFVSSQGNQFTLSQFADVREEMGESVLQRMNRLPSIMVNSAVVGRPPGTVAAEVEKEIAKIEKPAGVTWEFAGQIKRQKESFGSLGLALMMGILLVYLIMVALYENAIYPFVVLAALPLATVGAFLALALTMEDMTIFAMIGIIMLMGLVAKNGILLVDFTNQEKERGADVIHALIEAGRERFRPILMTTIAMIVGMLPIALASGSGAEVKNGMAWVIIGGLSSSLLLTLVVVPCVYLIVDRLKDWVNRKFDKRKEKAELAAKNIQL
jgi:HAE1 family hydrophobic/amphiphilic exporter-1